MAGVKDRKCQLLSSKLSIIVKPQLYAYIIDNIFTDQMSLNDYMDDPPEFESSDIDDTLRGTLIIYDSLAWKIMQVVDGHKQTFKYCKIVMK